MRSLGTARWLLGVLLAVSPAVLLASGLGGCSSGVGRPIREVVATPGSDGVQHVKVVAHSFWFDPNRVVVKAGVPVEIEITNGSFVIPHNLTCIAPAAGVEVDEGLGLFHDTERARFTPTTPGEYNFFCKKDAHANKGMTGILVVVP